MNLRKLVVGGVLALFGLGCAGEAPPHLEGDEAELLPMEQGLSAPETRPPGLYNGDVLPARTVQLTFDDGPSEWTGSFLDILKQKGVKATFFMNLGRFANGTTSTFTTKTGEKILARNLLARMAREGHVLANHTVNHPNLKTLTDAEVRAQLDKNVAYANRALMAAGVAPRVMTLTRPPFGAPWDTNSTDADRIRVGAAVSRIGLNILWNASSGDSSGWVAGEWYNSVGDATHFYDPTHPDYLAKVRQLVSTVLNNSKVVAGQGVNILFHDVHPTSRDALAEIIDGLKARGFTFITTETFALRQWGRPSRDLSPGPHLFDPLVEQKHWGCQDFSVAQGALAHTRRWEVCGQTWHHFNTYGGAGFFGLPQRAPGTFATRRSQWFERARLEHIPENVLPDNVRSANLGVERLTQLGIDWRTSTRPEFVGHFAWAGCVFTGVPGQPKQFNICDLPAGYFLTFYRSLGADADRLLGRPISRAHTYAATGRWSQWFEKGRIERRAGGTRLEVQLAAVGTEYLTPVSGTTVVYDGPELEEEEEPTWVPFDGGAPEVGSPAGEEEPVEAWGEAEDDHSHGEPTLAEGAPAAGGCGATNGSPLPLAWLLLLAALATRARARFP